MTSLLLLISFLLHLIVIIVVYQLYQQFQHIKENQQQQLQVILDDFMEKIQAENQKLESQMMHNDPSYTENEFTNKRIKQNRKKNNNSYMENSTVLQDLDNAKSDQVEVSTKGQILSLAAEGKSITEIAKIVNRGKTEVELILKMNNN